MLAAGEERPPWKSSSVEKGKGMKKLLSSPVNTYLAASGYTSVPSVFCNVKLGKKALATALFMEIIGEALTLRASMTWFIYLMLLVAFLL